MSQLKPLSISFIRFYILAFLFFAANSLLTIILPLQSEAEGIGQAEIGLMMGAYMLTCMFLRPYAGQLLGKYGPLAVMRGLLLVHFLCLVLYTFSGAEGFIWLRALQGAGTAFFSMTMQTGIVEQLADKDRAQGMSMYTLFTMVPSLFVPIVAMEVWESGMGWIYTLVVISIGALTLLVGFSVSLPKQTEHKKSYTLTEMFKSFGMIGKSRPLLVSSIVMLLGSCIFGATATFLPLYMVSNGAGSAGLYLMIQGIVVVGCRFVLRKKIPSDGSWNTALISSMLLCAAAGSLLLVLMDSIGGFVYISAVFNGIAVALLYPTLTTYLSFVLPVESRYVLMGLFMSSYDLGYSLGGLVMGIVIQSLSYQAMFAVCTVLALAAVLVVWVSKKQMEKTPKNSSLSV
ncbi:staphylopine family metallophore export MFS transporter CntE [Paenibacillus provencensis]|uniref:Staphylopine family metallophore export MFS transporter CntE n=1 Tax=Paenibacillus provencensis TaxID=441151 RepID=A0ABW3PTQ9_9BACL|nr:MFS transporter [Paenibacillus sp. MER 78]MCM3126775.1 MFS transporter [Paenibacillus sp. MER 78]